MAELTSAYDTLMDPRKRAALDQASASAAATEQRSPSGAGAPGVGMQVGDVVLQVTISHYTFAGNCVGIRKHPIFFCACTADAAPSRQAAAARGTAPAEERLPPCPRQQAGS
ncbi:unnamed protein product [Prorocentrum cordatum]|uniref:Uncharacterized protein n=1 Tax=Prorocentrum cordatum TaxID=2364126 RepID=A0ABN9VX65_9DINO|nr:unnamed protein product [Polarella glacialis]